MIQLKKVNSLLSKILTLVLFTILFSCSSEIEKLENSDQQKENFILLHKDYNYLKSNVSLFNKLSKLDTQKSTSKSKNIQTSDFTIFTDKVTYTKRPDNSRESYTFYIEKYNYASNKTVTNLILSRNIGEENFKVYIITYYFPDGIASEHNNFKVTDFREINSETFSFNNLASKSSCVSFYYDVIEIRHECYSGEHSGASQAGQCDGIGSLPYSTHQVVAYLTDSCGESGGGSSPGGGSGGPGGGGGSGGGSGGGGTTPVDTGISIPPPCQSVNCDVQILANDINDLLGSILNYQQLEFLLNNNDVAVEVKDFLDQNSSVEDKSYAMWTINYFIAHPTTSWQQFENWFMGFSEGEDGEYNASFWENPNLSFQQQNLPTFIDFKNACPSKYTNAQTLCTDIGGGILTMYNAVIAKGKNLNTCAIRISRALNYSGIIIPSLPDNPDGSKNTVLGSDGKNYIINAKALNIWMKKTFGTSSSSYKHYTALQGGTKGENFPSLLDGKQGIYSMVARGEIQKAWGTGHADLLENGDCLLNCHFYDTNNQFVPVDYIDVWILN